MINTDFERSSMKRLVVVSARIPSQDLEKLKEKANEEGCDLSVFIRKKLLEVICS
jgi:predicted DNA binding CopG/RHH family protein